MLIHVNASAFSFLSIHEWSYTFILAYPGSEQLGKQKTNPKSRSSIGIWNMVTLMTPFPDIVFLESEQMTIYLRVAVLSTGRSHLQRVVIAINSVWKAENMDPTSSEKTYKSYLQPMPLHRDPLFPYIGWMVRQSSIKILYIFPDRTTFGGSRKSYSGSIRCNTATDPQLRY